MKKPLLNNKGFAISGILYPIFVLFLILLFGIVGNLAASKAILDKNKRDMQSELNGDSVVPYFVFDGNDITIANGYAYTLTDGVSAYNDAGDQLNANQITYTSSPTFNNAINGVYTVTYTATDNLGKSTTKNKIIRVEPKVYTLEYTGGAQAFPTTLAGTYKIELWGAQGGSVTPNLGSKGGYTKGDITLTSAQATNFSVFVGQGNVNIGNVTSFNSGTASGGGMPGGGATDLRYLPRKYRYVRDYVNGSTANVSNHWVEIQVFDKDGTNIALGKPVTGSVAVADALRPYGWATDGDLNSANWTASTTSGLQYVEIDLGAEYEIASIKVWHYYADGRTYNNSKTVLEKTGHTGTWAIFDSAWSGIYAEATTGTGLTTDLLDWKNFDSLSNRIMVAGGAGAGVSTGGVGGNLTGGNGTNVDITYSTTYEGFGGTQTAAGLSTYGATSSGFGFSNNGCAGGGGYYGGGGAVCVNGGGGGSSFISGYAGCNAISPSSTPIAIIHTGSSLHYNGFSFTNSSMISGNASMPDPLGITETGHSGNGYARITVLKQINS